MKPALVLVLAFLATAAPGQKRPKDTIVLRDGARLRGVEVVELGLEAVSFRRGGRLETIPAAGVRSVQWDEPPRAWLEAEVAEQSGELERASELFAAAGRASDRAPFALEARFHSARTLIAAAPGLIAGAPGLIAAAPADPQKVAAARAVLEQYVAVAAHGFRARDAKLLACRALVLEGKAADAETRLRELERSTGPSLAGAPRARLALELGVAQTAQSRPADARLAYQVGLSAVDGAEARAGSVAERAELADLRLHTLAGIGGTYLTERNHAAALRFFAEIAPADAPPLDRLQALALAGQGEALYLQGCLGDDPRRLREAQVMLARATLADPDGGELSARAEYFAALALEALGDGREQDARARGRSLLAVLIKGHPASEWARRARAELERR